MNQCFLFYECPYGRSALELKSEVEEYFPIYSIHPIYKFILGKLYSIGISTITFYDQTQVNQFSHSSNSLNKLRIFEINDQNLLNFVFLFGFPKDHTLQECISIFKDYLFISGTHFKDTTFDNDSIFILQLQNYISAKEFCHRFNNIVIEGYEIFVCQFSTYDLLNSFNCSLEQLSFCSSSIHNSISLPQDFTLKHLDRLYLCWSGSAIGICGSISKCAEKNPNISEFEIFPYHAPFDLVYKYILGNPIQLTLETAVSTYLFSNFLEITELQEASKRYIFEPPTYQEAFYFLNELFNLGGNYEHHLSITAANFDKIINSQFFLQTFIQPNESQDILLNLIISSPFFDPKFEDLFFSWAMKYRKDLIPLVKIQHLSQVCLDELFQNSSICTDLNFQNGLIALFSKRRQLSRKNDTSIIHFPSGNINQAIPRFSGTDGTQQSISNLFGLEVVMMENNQYLNGIFTRIFKRYHTFKNEVTVTASSVKHLSPDIIIHPENTTWFGTQDQPRQWIMFNFVHYTVSLFGYTLKTHSQYGNGHLCGWRLLGSENCKKWVLIDAVGYSTDLNELGAVKYFNLPQPTPTYKFFKLEQTRRNTLDFDNLRLTRVEFFGILK